MRTLTLLVIGLLAPFGGAQGRPLDGAQGPPSVQPGRGGAPACTTATAACTEWVSLGPGPARSLVYRTRPLDVRNDAVRRALIMVHGTNRNADHYFSTATAAAFLAGALEDTVVIAPHMIDQSDKAETNEVVWESSWRTGGASRTPAGLSSFDFVD